VERTGIRVCVCGESKLFVHSQPPLRAAGKRARDNTIYGCIYPLGAGEGYARAYVFWSPMTPSCVFDQNTVDDRVSLYSSIRLVVLLSSLLLLLIYVPSTYEFTEFTESNIVIAAIINVYTISTRVRKYFFSI